MFFSRDNIYVLLRQSYLLLHFIAHYPLLVLIFTKIFFMEHLLSIISICCIVFIVHYAITTGLTNGLYMLHKKAYKKYQEEVATEEKLYNRYVLDFCNENIFLYSVKEDITVEELNKRNKNYNIVTTLLQERSDLVEKYFNRPSFSLDDFQELSKEFNTTESPIRDELPIEEPKPIEEKTEQKSIIGKDNPFNCKLNGWKYQSN